MQLQEKLLELPPSLAQYHLQLADSGKKLVFTYDTRAERTGITTLLNDMREAGIAFNDLETAQSSLEDIFVGLVHQTK